MRDASLGLLVALAFVPSALALDAFPQEASWGAWDARVLVRLPAGGVLHVETTPRVGVALADAPGGAPAAPLAPTPADFEVVPRDAGDSWHGLAGTVELVLHRDDPDTAVEVLAEDENGGAVFEWPAQAARGVAGPSAAALALAGIAASAAALAWGPRRRRG